MESNKQSFGALSTAIEVIEGIDLQGRTALVTGANSGIGLETARALAVAGADVVLGVRDVVAGEAVAANIRHSTGLDSVRVAEIDLADLTSVRRLVDAWSGPLHLLVANAGVMHTPEQRTRQGREMQFGVNHVGHFALAVGLRGALVEAGGARIVAVSSSGHAASGIRFDDVDFRTQPYDANLAYGQSKTANVLFALEVTKRWADDGIAASAVMPGGVWTGLQRWWDPAVLADMKRRYVSGVKSPQQGAATSVFVATRAPIGPGAPAYWEDCHPAEVVSRITDGLHGVLPHAIDSEAADRLWALTLRLLE